MFVLGIESTCDETACSVVENGTLILSNVVTSQHDIHSQYGGVFPELASRRHAETMIPVINQALMDASLTLDDIDLIAVANGPGLMGSLLVGVNAAKSLSLSLKKPLIGVNHVEAHLYAALMSQSELPTFPCLGVVLSGAHTSLVLIEEIGKYSVIGQTIDDAIGEAFDKVAKVMDLDYPGGPKVEKLARDGNPHTFPLKSGRVKGKTFHFSFSGIKTGVLYAVKGQNGKEQERTPITKQEKADIAASFQHAVFSDIIKKSLLAAKEYNCQTLIFGGGVTNSQTLREMYRYSAPEYTHFWPSGGLSLDNGAMIAGLGYHAFQRKMHGDSLDLEALTRITF